MNTILVIEDETLIREDICMVLELEGFDTLSAENGREGLALLADKRPDLIICDVLMPEMSGIDFIQALRETPGHQTIPFIFLSAKTTDEDITNGLDLGADAYLKKPFKIVDLVETARTFLSD